MKLFRQPVRSEEEIIQKDIHNLKKQSFNPKTKARQKVPLTTEGLKEYQAEEKTKPDGQTDVKISHVAGPIRGSFRKIQASFLGQESDYDENIIYNWKPQMSLVVVDDSSGRPLTAAQIESYQTTKKNWMPTYFVNPMQDLDYMTYEAILKHTITGPIMNALTKFIVGTGFRPELELINPSKDPDKDVKLIEENQEIIDNLTRIDHQLSYDQNENEIDIHFVDKVAALIDATNSFNRSALIFGYEKPVEINGKSYKEIPTSIKFAHPRDLGIIQASPDSWRLQAVQYRHAFYMIPARDMIYLWNPLVSAKHHNSWLYGGSMVSPMLDASRVIRQIVGVDFPAMAEATWAGMYVLTIKPKGTTQLEKESEYSAIADNMVRGGPNILLEDPANIGHYNVDFNPKINEFKDLMESLAKYNVACIGLPHSLFYDESASNRSTMLGKIQLAKETVINPMRNSIGRSFSDQWYMRWFRLLYKDTKPELLKLLRIKMVFDDLHIEQWFDRVEATNAVDERKQLTDEAYGEMLGLDNYISKVDPNAQTKPGGGGSKIKFGDEKGNKFELKKSNREF